LFTWFQNRMSSANISRMCTLLAKREQSLQSALRHFDIRLTVDTPKLQHWKEFFVYGNWVLNTSQASLCRHYQISSIIDTESLVVLSRQIKRDKHQFFLNVMLSHQKDKQTSKQTHSSDDAKTLLLLSANGWRQNQQTPKKKKKKNDDDDDDDTKTACEKEAMDARMLATSFLSRKIIAIMPSSPLPPTTPPFQFPPPNVDCGWLIDCSFAESGGIRITTIPVREQLQPNNFSAQCFSRRSFSLRWYLP